MRRIFMGEIGLVETFGKYTRSIEPGIRFYIPLIQDVRVINSNISHINNSFYIKTKDDAFAKVNTDLFYKITKPFDFAYVVRDPLGLVSSSLEENVRSAITNTNLKELYESKDLIQNDIGNRMHAILESSGMTLNRFVISSIDPDDNIKKAMNSIVTARREQEAVLTYAETARLKIIKEAEAEATRMRLKAEGLRDQRKIIGESLLAGLNVTPEQATSVLMTSEYISVLSDIAKNKNSKIILFNSDIGGANEVISRMKAALMD